MTSSAPVLSPPPGRTAEPAPDIPSPLATKLAEHFRGDRPGPRTSAAGLTSGVRECLALALRALSASGPQEAAGLTELVGHAADWAREGIDLDTVLRAYHEAIRRGFEQVAAEQRCTPAELLAGTEDVLRVLETVTVATSSAYLDEHRLAARHHQTAAQTLVTALLSGHGREALARRTGITVAAAYQVVALSIPPHPGEQDPQLNTEGVARRKLRRLQSALAPVLGSRALSLLSVDGGTILVPVEDPAGLNGALAMTGDTLDVLSAAASVPLTATVVTGATERIPELAEQARELLELVRALERPPGLYRMADVAVEYQLTRPGPAREHLAAALDPLAPHPELLDTLRGFLAAGLDRRATAGRLRIHPNSVSHRLRRIERLAGIDLSHPEGISRASLALLAHDLDAA
ncbi:PucR family transcriptional regulator [Nocardia blacklockiae]|uniref:PucR family transcriptional regulator n=1 Tax=Nocardia blacklockiae TaxID=480036 RepID=UPI0018956827|nr:helix-turn-helix domain-containing protein [Nocardia blacklockiae]MBF6175700.1 helix-turn-helix domain-containing protein [Nocardia blacklockiae]